MGVHIKVSYEGELQCQAEHGPSKDRLATDAPVDNQGKGQHFSPTDLLATSLGACMLTTMGIAAKPRQLDLRGAAAEVEKHMGATPRRHVEKLTVKITLPAALETRDRSVLETAARTCPVAESLASTTQIDLSFSYQA